jgi:hypothetical protein
MADPHESGLTFSCTTPPWPLKIHKNPFPSPPPTQTAVTCTEGTATCTNHHVLTVKGLLAKQVRDRLQELLRAAVALNVVLVRLLHNDRQVGHLVEVVFVPV